MPNYEKELNKSQYEAVTCGNGPTLVVAGAGTGKTRTIVYRLAWLAENGVAPESIALLTFTRKAAANMLQRAAMLHSAANISSITGGTFHSFAYSVLRRWQPDWLEGRQFTLMDSEDITHALRRIKENLALGGKDPTFPKIPAIASILSKARNKEASISQVLNQSAPHLLPHAEALEELAFGYHQYRRANALLDYDDLLFELEEMLTGHGDRAAYLRKRFSHVLVDEYQDTNLVQGRIVRLLSTNPDGSAGNIMAVGDEAQSIYAFRGANIRNILEFPLQYKGCRVIPLEENYRSTKPILDLANAVISRSVQSFGKNLYTSQPGGELTRLVRPLSDSSEALVVSRRIQELLQVYPPSEIAVLFRSGFHSYGLEAELRKQGISFRKYGGLRFVEAAHIRDVLAYARLAINPMDLPAFMRLAQQCRGVGEKTAEKLYQLVADAKNPAQEKLFLRHREFLDDLLLLEDLRKQNPPPAKFFERIIDWHKPKMERLYPEDWPRRAEALGEILQIARNYNDLDLFVADIALENPDDTRDGENCVTLSTIHSAKGLEWDAVLILDLVEDRFPSRKAAARPEDFEEERRLMYVACTRARKVLELYSPAALYSRETGSMSQVRQSQFTRDLGPDVAARWQELLGGALAPVPHFAEREARGGRSPDFASPEIETLFEIEDTEIEEQPTRSGLARGTPGSGYCLHRIFGRGKIVKVLGPDKVQVNFPGFGLKVILTDYLVLED